MTDRTLRTSADLDVVDFAKADGLVPVVAQDAGDGRVLMVAWANRDALAASLETGRMHFWSRSRGELWMKGETSGNVLELTSLHADCDGDTVLALVRPTGPACHTGEETCFGSVDGSEEAATTQSESLGPNAAPEILACLDAVVAERQRDRPEGSYTVKLLDDENLRLKKLGEETAELVAALAKSDSERIPQEAADLLYHLLVALRGAGVELTEALAALEERRR